MTKNDDKGRRSSQVIFVYRNSKLAFALISSFSLGFFCITLFALAHGIGIGLGLFMMFLSLFLITVSCVAIFGQSDIVIDDEGISRRLLGRTWRTIRWEDVRIIRAFHVPALGFNSRTLRAFAIYPAAKAAGISCIPKQIGFTENFTEIDSLIKLINFYATKHEIEIEASIRGKKAKATYL